MNQYLQDSKRKCHHNIFESQLNYYGGGQPASDYEGVKPVSGVDSTYQLVEYETSSSIELDVDIEPSRCFNIVPRVHNGQ